LSVDEATSHQHAHQSQPPEPAGIRLQGITHQAHWNTDSPTLALKSFFIKDVRDYYALWLILQQN
jgi:hypothetical protein